MATPESVVLAFIGDYKQWNDRAYERCENDSSPESFDQAHVEYDWLLSQYCRPGVSRKAIAFGSKSNHDPDKEKIRTMATDGDRSVVATTIIDDNGYADAYEYFLLLDGDQWFLEGIDHIDDEGRGPIL